MKYGFFSLSWAAPVPIPHFPRRTETQLKHVILLFIVLFAPEFAAAAQDARGREPQTSLYFEGLGNAGLYSINVDRTLANGISLRVGVSKWSGEDFLGFGSDRYLMFPVMANYLIGKKNSMLEIGGGVLLGKTAHDSSIGEGSTRHWFSNLTAVLGYRYQPVRGGFLFRVGLTPFYSLNDEQTAYPDTGFLLSMGLSIGYTFRSQE